MRRLGSKHGRRRTPSVQGIILCPLLEEILLGLDHPTQTHRQARRLHRGGKRADRAHKHSRIRIYKQSVWTVAVAWRLAARTPTRRASVKREAYAPSSVCMYTLLAARPLRFAAGSRRSATPRMTALLRWVA